MNGLNHTEYDMKICKRKVKESSLMITDVVRRILLAKTTTVNSITFDYLLAQEQRLLP